MVVEVVDVVVLVVDVLAAVLGVPTEVVVVDSVGEVELFCVLAEPADPAAAPIAATMMSQAHTGSLRIRRLNHFARGAG